MRSSGTVVFFSFVATLAVAGCSNDTHRSSGGGGGGGGGHTGPPTLTIVPTDVTLDVVAGMPAPTQTFIVTWSDDSGTKDVGSIATLVLDDLTLGMMTESVFTAAGNRGGTTRVVATYGASGVTPISVAANIHIKLHGSFQGLDCAGCPQFPADGAPACDAAAAPKVIYPLDGVLLPPNLNQFEIQFVQGTPGTFYEVDFENAVTDVRITTKCPAVMDTGGMKVAKACVLAIDPQWDFVAKSNKGGEPLVVTVRATTDGTCAATSTNSVNVLIAEEDTAGGIYYWKSKFTPMGSGGDIWRKAFGSTKPEEKITPDKLSGNFTNYPCWGCHSLSRDGARMMINVDDSDSDDEYTDVSAGLFDVGAKKFITSIGYSSGMVPGFQTFNNDHSLVLGSDGDGGGSRTAGGFGGSGGNQLFLWKGTDGTTASPASVTIGTAKQRPTMPDWSLDNKTVVYVMPTSAGWGGGGFFGNSHTDDAHVFGGSLFTISYANGMFGAPVSLVPSGNGANNYYPSLSPDSSYIVYNHVDHQTTKTGALDWCNPKSGQFAGSCPNDSFSNPKARLWAVTPTAGSTPVDLANANGSSHGSPVDVSNSWPRWSPFVQKYKDTKLLWITFSSTRDYGARVRNHVAGLNQQQCYPADSAEDPNGSHGQAIAGNCQQPQLWMAAINISGGEQGQVGDPSFPAFWLPFQDITTHNHTAQWTATIVNMPDMMCAKAGENCMVKPCCPNEGVCLANGTCGVP